jgi:hypothetical protein
MEGIRSFELLAWLCIGPFTDSSGTFATAVPIKAIKIAHKFEEISQILQFDPW